MHYKLFKFSKKNKATGVFIGENAETIDRITPERAGYVRFKGEYWQAKSDNIIEPGTKVVILKKDGSILIVNSKE